METCEIPADPAEQASKLIDAFESVGVTEFKAVFLSAEPVGGKARYVGDESGSPARMRARAHAFVERSERRAESVSLRPTKGGALIQVDDATPEQLARLLPFCFFVAETSPGNFQPWIALRPDIGEAARKDTRERLLRLINPEKRKDAANLGAGGAVRMAGTLCTKHKYRERFGEFPRVRLVHLAPGLMCSPLELERAGLLAPVVVPVPRPEAVRDVAGRLPSGWPDLARYKSSKWLSRDNRPDRSSAEAAWVGAAWRMGWPEHMIVAQLERITEKGRGRSDDYCAKTVRNVVGYVSAQPDTRAARGRERIAV